MSVTRTRAPACGQTGMPCLAASSITASTLFTPPRRHESTWQKRIAPACAHGDAAAAMAAFVARQPVGRLGNAEEIAALVVHLASDEPGYTSGAVHVIDGGWSG